MFYKVYLVTYFILMLSTPVHLSVCRALDVVFVVDSGLDVPDTDWKLMTEMSRDVAYDLQPSTYGSHVALKQFSNITSIVHGLDTTLAIGDRYDFLQTGRNLSDAIDTTRRLVLNNMGGDRPEVPDVIILIINGLVDDKRIAVQEATRVKSEGIRIITVGVTNTQVDQVREELREIATDPEDVENLMLISPNYYLSVVTVLKEIVCRNTVQVTEGSLRLADGTSNSGRLEVYTNEEWVTVCSTGWIHLNTRIACKQLEFPDGQSMYTMNQTSYHRRIGVANIQCTDNDTKLLQCSHDPLFHIDPSCDHKRDVFLRCLCGDCNDYTPRDNVRLADGTLISGRLEVFSPRVGWGGVCSSGWTSSNTRVACRQLGFLDEAGAYQRHLNQSVTFVLFHVSCVGNENSLFDCEYSTMSKENCFDPMYIRCQCNHCSELLLEAPQQTYAMIQSSALFEWRLKHNISAFEIWYLSQKNPQALMYVEDGNAVKGNTRFTHRIQLIEDDHYATIKLQLTNITTADMGVYSLHVPMLLDSSAILIVRDFAVVPETVVHHEVHDRVTMSWDLTALRRLRDISHEMFLTTPATGRLKLDYYYTSWLRDNPHRHVVPQPRDHLHPTIIIAEVTAKDAGSYVIEVSMTSSVYQRVNYSWRYETDVVVGVGTYMCSNDASKANNLPVNALPAIVVFGVMLGLAVVALIVLLSVCRKRGTTIRRLKTEATRRTRYQQQSLPNDPHRPAAQRVRLLPPLPPTPQTPQPSRFDARLSYTQPDMYHDDYDDGAHNSDF